MLQFLAQLYGAVAVGALALSVFVFPVLAIFRRTRAAAAVGLVISSYVLGAGLWFTACFAVLEYWGVVAMLIGILFFGVGVLPMSWVIFVWHAEWSILAFTAAWFGIVIVLRVVGAVIGSKSEKYS